VANAVADAVGVRPRSYPLAPWKVLEWLREQPTGAGFRT
jgi:CO/xanthine dehydrogenase Mo-binding subunit